MYRINLSYSESLTIARNVYDRQPDRKNGIETGFIRYGSSYVPVWRRLRKDGFPVDHGRPENPAETASIWHNIYETNMDFLSSARGTVICKRKQTLFNENILTLPVVSVKYARSFAQYLASLK